MERKEAIEVIKKNWPDSSFTMLREALETLIPELVELEDEKIRKEMIKGISKTRPNTPFLDTNITREDALAWLEKQGEQKPTEWSEKDETELTNTIIMLKEGASLHFNKKDITKAVDYLKSLKDRVGCEADCITTQEWSEEDEKLFEYALNMIEWYSVVDKDKSIHVSGWLKYLKYRYTLKPSDEQMEALEHFIVYHNGSTNYAKDLEELRLQLKKLKDE